MTCETNSANVAVHFALDELASSGLQDTAPLERALLDATVLVAVWSVHRPGARFADEAPIVVEHPRGSTLLAVFTDQTRLDGYAMQRAYRSKEVAFRSVPYLVGALGYHAVVLDPGHVNSRILSPPLLARAACASRS